MTQNSASQTLPPEDEISRKQSATQDGLRTLQQGTPNKTVQDAIKPQYPAWPTSKPGPRSTPPPPGMRSVSPIRPEQMKELNYNQETGEPDTQSPLRSMPDASLQGPTGFDQQETAQESLKKRKERL